MQDKKGMIKLARRTIYHIGKKVKIWKFKPSEYDTLYEEDKEREYILTYIQAKVEKDPEQERYSNMGTELDADIFLTTLTEDTDINYDDVIEYAGKRYSIIVIREVGEYGEDFIITKILGKLK